jgi:3-oxoacyl-[acyl-carrier protein] reductase
MQNKKSTGKKILVTGATGGIGIELCGHLASQGYGLILTARNEERLLKLTQRIKDSYRTPAICLPSDFSDQTTFDALIEKTQDGLDGIVLMPPQVDPTAECLPKDTEWEHMFKTSFIGPLALIRALLPALKKSERSKVVLISGISSAQVLSHYATSNVLRLAWLAQMKTLAHKYGPEKIHFNTLSLGGVLTDEYLNELGQDAKKRGITFGEAMAEQVDNVPLRKYAVPHQVGMAVEGLLGGFSDHMTGLNILCDGGFTRAY